MVQVLGCGEVFGVQLVSSDWLVCTESRPAEIVDGDFEVII